jgi:glycosyltransferase involved in cell wall biosynthesis
VASRSLKGIANIALGDSNELDRLNRFKNIPENLRKETTLSNYDVVHAHFATCYGHSLLAVPDFIKKVLSVWGEDVLDEALHGPDMKKRLIDSLEAADHITVTSEHMRAVLTDKYSVQRQKIWVIPWGHRKIFKREEQSLNIFEKFGLSPGVPIITSGRVCRKQNNIESIVDAFMEADINAQLLVMTGKISDQLYLSQLKAKTSQNPKIIYIDNVNEEDLLQIYNISEAIISIPDVDQLSTTIIESLACGTPVICSDIEVYHERIVHGKNGCFINSRNKEQLQKALRYFSEGNAKKAMRNFAMQSVKGDSWEDNVKKLMSVYDAPK